MSTLLSKIIRVRPDDELLIRIEIGYGQLGKSTVQLGQDYLATNQEGNLTLALPGKGKDLAGRTLLCTSVVADVRTETNQTCVTYSLSGGETSWSQTLQESVQSDGDILFYSATMRFYC